MFITPQMKDFFMNTSKFVTLEGEERSIEEQVQYLSQMVRVLQELSQQNVDLVDSILNRLHYLENQ